MHREQQDPHFLGVADGQDTLLMAKAAESHASLLASYRNAKQFNDPIHGHIKLPNYCIEFVDTPQFQRLRDLKQLGTSYYVFPGASHNRFEHCLGVCHLSGALLERTMLQQPELDITGREVKLVRLAGLCHDIGHGPFSHAFEHWAEGHSSGWSHEDMSQKVVKYLIDDNGLDYSAEDIRFINSLITGDRPPDSNEKAFLYDIVANNRNSIDVDKFDYIARDCRNTGLHNGFDHQRLMGLSRVIGNEICFSSKGDFEVYELFRTRYSLWKQIYSHPVSKAIEYMIADAMTEADDYLHISASLSDVEEYCLLSDCILKQIEYSKAPELTKAREIVRNIRKRKHYKMVGEFIIPPEKKAFFPREVTERDIITCEIAGVGMHSASMDLQEEDIIVQNLVMNYGLQDQNPVDHVRFFNKDEPNSSFVVEKHQVSMLIPDLFSEHYVRVFCRNPAKKESAERAFRAFLERQGVKPTGRVSHGGTPAASPSRPGVAGGSSAAVGSLSPRNLNFE
ncbi:HD-domain PDEase [Balamuthia mandrillaris]